MNIVASIKVEYITPDKLGRKWSFDFRPEGVLEKDMATWEYLNRYLSIIMNRKQEEKNG